MANDLLRKISRQRTVGRGGGREGKRGTSNNTKSSGKVSQKMGVNLDAEKSSSQTVPLRARELGGHAPPPIVIGQRSPGGVHSRYLLLPVSAGSLRAGTRVRSQRFEGLCGCTDEIIQQINKQTSKQTNTNVKGM